MGILEGKVVVITGGTRGLGLAIAQAYSQEGAAVVVGSRSFEAVEQAVANLQRADRQAAGQPCDVTDKEQVQALADFAVQQFDRIDIWVNNAALSGPYGPTAHIPMDQFELALRANILGTYYGSVIAMRHFLAQNSGKLINLLGAGDRRPTPMQNPYAASKSWVRNFTLALAKEYKDSGVGVYAFHPGLMNTELLTRVDVVEGYQSRLNVFGTIIRMWANSPEVPARKAVWVAGPATDGRTGLVVRANGRGHMFAGMVKEAWRRLTRQTLPLVELDLNIIPSSLEGVD